MGGTENYWIRGREMSISVKGKLAFIMWSGLKLSQANIDLNVCHHLLGVAVLVDPEVPLHVGVDSQHQYCLRTPPNADQLPLQYMVCVGPNAKVVHQEAARQISNHKRVLPNMDILR